MCCSEKNSPIPRIAISIIPPMALWIGMGDSWYTFSQGYLRTLFESMQTHSVAHLCVLFSLHYIRCVYQILLHLNVLFKGTTERGEETEPFLIIANTFNLVTFLFKYLSSCFVIFRSFDAYVKMKCVKVPLFGPFITAIFAQRSLNSYFFKPRVYKIINIFTKEKSEVHFSYAYC